MSHVPEEDLAHEFQRQEKELHGNLFMLNELFQICCDDTLSEKELLRRALPIVEKFSENNPMIAKEIKEVLVTGDHKKIETYFEQEKDQLVQALSATIKEHKGMNTRINKETIDNQPTDS